jgi:hypothetical protein
MSEPTSPPVDLTPDPPMGPDTTAAPDPTEPPATSMPTTNPTPPVVVETTTTTGPAPGSLAPVLPAFSASYTVAPGGTLHLTAAQTGFAAAYDPTPIGWSYVKLEAIATDLPGTEYYPSGLGSIDYTAPAGASGTFVVRYGARRYLADDTPDRSAATTNEITIVIG